jgi:signal transduction histidine kinase
MSHEMLTPMNVIIGMTQVAKRMNLSEEASDCLMEIESASMQLLHMVNDVLDIVNIEYNAFKLTESIFDFNKMLHGVVNSINYNAVNKQQSLESKIDPAIPSLLLGDEKRISQVIYCLLGNAVKFTPMEGEISLNAHIFSEDAVTVTIQIDVTDNGIGISESQKNKLFDIFEQEDGGITRNHGGIGIGLALSKRIAEMMGGGIRVESELGKGTKFVFTCVLKR